MREVRCDGAMMWALMLTSAISACQSDDGDEPVEVTAPQVAVVDQDAVGAANVELALQALWPLLDEFGALSDDVAALALSNQQLDGRISTLETELAAHVNAGGEASLKDAVLALQKAMGDQAAQLSALEESVASIQTAITAAERNSAQLQAAVDQLANELTETTSSIGKPRDCPEGMLALDELTCIELDMRPAQSPLISNHECRAAGRRMCSLDEIYVACKEMEEEFAGSEISEFPHWIREGTGVIVTAEGWQLSSYALGGPVCWNAWEGSATKSGEDDNTNKYNYRCCLDRQ